MTSAPFAQQARSYLDRGFSPIPILPGTKRPGTGPKARAWDGADWPRYCRAPATADQINAWLAQLPGAGIGLCCGFGGLVAIDVDDARAAPAVRQILGGRGVWMAVRICTQTVAHDNQPLGSVGCGL